MEYYLGLVWFLHINGTNLIRNLIKSLETRFPKFVIYVQLIWIILKCNISFCFYLINFFKAKFIHNLGYNTIKVFM